MQRSKTVISLILLFLSTSALADLQSPYYPKKFVKKLERNELTSTEIKEKLFDLISHHKTSLTYKEARTFLFGKIFLQKVGKSYFIEDSYCQKSFDQNVGVGPMKIPDSRSINCEHTWPQSRFSQEFPKATQKNDLHHLFPVDSRANSSRSNHIFAEVDGHEVNETCTTSFRGRANGSTVTAFEPPEEHKGNVARALFYFSIRYKINIGPLEEGFLREWHREDPVDDAEEKRNTMIFSIQGNRNPFIDSPDLVNSINNF